MLSSTRSRPATRQFRHQAVTRVIEQMNGRLADEMSTKSLAEIAYISPFHFNRVFRQVTGIPPCHFLTALRLDAARRLLLTTDLSVTDVCFEVGYNSLGTFTTRFHRAFGVSPRDFRRLALRTRAKGADPASQRPDAARPGAVAGATVTGRIDTVRGFRGVICVGAFPTAVPEGAPIACALLDAPGRYTLEDVPSGQYYLLAAALENSADAMPDLTNATLLRGRAEPSPVTIDGTGVSSGTDILLRAPEVTDPPLLSVLPLLIATHQARQLGQP